MNRRAKFQLPPHGEYILQAPSEFSQDAFGATKVGNLIITIDPTVAEGPHAGFQVRRTRISGKVFKRDGRNVSQIGDYLTSIGFEGRVTNDQEAADAVEATAGRQFKAELDWRAENFRTGFKLEGMRKFPRNPDGTYQQWVEDPTEKGADGAPLRLLANVYVRNYIPAEK